VQSGNVGQTDEGQKTNTPLVEGWKSFVKRKKIPKKTSEMDHRTKTRRSEQTRWAKFGDKTFSARSSGREGSPEKRKRRERGLLKRQKKEIEEDTRI